MLFANLTHLIPILSDKRDLMTIAQLTSSRLAVFSAAPHRMFFFFGAISLLTSMAWWLLELGTLFFGTPAPHTGLLPVRVHGLLMGYGLFTFFIFGFLSTTFPRWMNRPDINQSIYAPAAWLLFAGYVTLLVASTYSKALLILGLSLMLLGWLQGLRGLVDVFLKAENKASHAWATLAGLLCGVLSLLLAIYAVITDSDALLSWLLKNLIWWYLIPVYFSVCHRMVPFFSNNAAPNYQFRRPEWPLPWMLAGTFCHPLFDAIGLAILPELLMLAIAMYLFVLWQPWKCLHNPLLASLHIGFMWLSIGLLLQLIQSIWWTVSDELIIPRAPLHALTIGFLSAMLVAMATRVTQGHSGGQLVMSRLTWGLFFGVQLCAITRLLAEFSAFQTVAPHLIVLSALLWLACFIPWVVQYAPLYLRARRDGRPG